MGTSSSNPKNPTPDHVPPLTSTTSRRALLTRGALIAMAGVAMHGGARAAVPTATATRGLSGKISVLFDVDPIRAPYVAKAAATVKAANPDAEIKISEDQASESEYLLKLLLALRAGHGPDVFLANSVVAGILAAGGALAPLDAYVKAWPDWSFYPQRVRDAVTYKGQICGIPFGLDTHFLYYRRDIFQQAGLPADWKPADPAGILDAAKAIKAKVPDVIPYALYAGQNGGPGTAIRGFVPLLAAYGGALKDAAGKWIIDSCPIREALDYYAAAYQQDKVVPQQVITTPGVAMAMQERFGQGKLGILFEGAWAYGPWAKADPTGAKEHIGYDLFPAAGGRPPFTIGGSGDLWYINAATKHPDLAWEYVRTWNNKDTVLAVCIADPHPPARTDARAEMVAQSKQDPDGAFLAASAASLDSAIFSPPDPHYQDLATILYDVTASVATGQLAPDKAVTRYAANLTRVLGSDNVTTEPCSTH